MIIGLTGTSGAGKSTVAALFGKAGFRIIDCDGLVHSLDRDPVYVEQIEETFGADTISEGAVNRRALAALAFSDRAALARLNRTIAPFIDSLVRSEIDAARRAGADAVVDAPLLFEYELEKICDVTVGVTAPADTAVRRLSLRDGRTEKELLARRSFQHDDAFFVRQCDIVIENAGTQAALSHAFAAALSEIEKRRRI